MKYAIINENRSSLLPLDFLCSIFSVSRSGFYDWIDRQFKLPDPKEKDLESNVIRIYFESKRRYGHRKVCKQAEAEGIHTSPGKVLKIMRSNCLKSTTKKVYKINTTISNHKNKVSPRLFDIFNTTVTATNQVWAGDITYIPTQEGFVYLSVFIDLYSRKVTGWAVADHMRSELVRQSFVMSLIDREISSGLIIHTDRGVQYTASDFRVLLESLNLNQSMSRKGNCYDNAFVESFFALMKKELPKFCFNTKKEAKDEILDFIHWYNSNRIHSSIDYKSPNDFEQLNAAIAA